MPATETISATEFKAKCLDILDRISRREMDRLSITKRGAVVAVLVPPDVEAIQVENLHGFMRGSVVIPEGADLTAPIIDDAWSVEQGDLHG
jgi:antitoxin (DNA-binding transcriptional repressor) of toxin-antitoxin stability system